MANSAFSPGGGVASNISVDVSGFAGNLSSLDTDVQKSLNTIDDLPIDPAISLKTDIEIIQKEIVTPSTPAATYKKLYPKAEDGIDTYTVLALHMEGVDESTAFNDDSFSQHSMSTGGNAQIDTAQKKFGVSSALFDGTGDYITSPDSSDWTWGVGNFTVDFWIRFNSLTASVVFWQHWQNASNEYNFQKATNAGGNKLRFVATYGGVKKADYVMTNAWAGVATGTWYHIAVVRNGTSLLIFIDGVSQTLTETTAISTNNLSDLSGLFYIGDYGTGGYGVNGWIDEFRISKGMARWTSNFTPPSIRYFKSGYYFLDSAGNERELLIQ